MLLLVLGFAAGILSGLLGIGGGLIFTPVMLYLFDFHGVDEPVKWTIGTSLFCSFSSALSSSVPQLRKYRLFAKEALWLSLYGVLGTVAAQMVVNSGYYRKGPFAVLFGLVLMYTAYRFFQNNLSSIEEKRNHRPVALGLKQSVLVGGSSGLVSSLVGVGGGIVVVPLLTLVYHQHIRKVVAISSLVVVLLALSGWLQLAVVPSTSHGISEFTWGHVDFGAALPLVVGSFLGAMFGMRMAKHVNRKALQRIFAFLAIGLALKLWWDYLL